MFGGGNAEVWWRSRPWFVVSFVLLSGALLLANVAIAGSAGWVLWLGNEFVLAIIWYLAYRRSERARWEPPREGPEPLPESYRDSDGDLARMD